MWVGIGEGSKVGFIAYATFFPMFVTSVHAVRQVDPLLLRAAQSLGARPRQLFFRVILPAALPEILTGLRLGVALAFFVIVISEFIGAEHGLGYLINDGRNFFLVPQMLGAAVVLPVRRGTDLVAFVCLGSKQSGDVYTSTDLALLAGVAHALSRDLLRFDDAQIIREGRAMQEALRRYLPEPVAAHLAGGKSTQAGEREVSALFVDIRGFTTAADGAAPSDAVARLNEFFEVAVPALQAHGGHANKFVGDGLLAVFGVPEHHADHADRALRGEEVPDAVPYHD